MAMRLFCVVFKKRPLLVPSPDPPHYALSKIWMAGAWCGGSEDLLGYFHPSCNHSLPSGLIFHLNMFSRMTFSSFTIIVQSCVKELEYVGVSNLTLEMGDPHICSSPNLYH